VCSGNDREAGLGTFDKNIYIENQYFALYFRSIRNFNFPFELFGSQSSRKNKMGVIRLFPMGGENHVEIDTNEISKTDDDEITGRALRKALARKIFKPQLQIKSIFRYTDEDKSVDEEPAAKRQRTILKDGNKSDEEENLTIGIHDIVDQDRDYGFMVGLPDKTEESKNAHTRLGITDSTINRKSRQNRVNVCDAHEGDVDLEKWESEDEEILEIFALEELYKYEYQYRVTLREFPYTEISICYFRDIPHVHHPEISGFHVDGSSNALLYHIARAGYKKLAFALASSSATSKLLIWHNQGGVTVFQQCVMNGCVEAALVLLDHERGESVTVLEVLGHRDDRATGMKNVKEANYKMRNGEVGCSPIFIAIENGYVDLVLAMLKKFPSIKEMEIMKDTEVYANIISHQCTAFLVHSSSTGTEFRNWQKVETIIRNAFSDGESELCTEPEMISVEFSNKKCGSLTSATEVTNSFLEPLRAAVEGEAVKNKETDKKDAKKENDNSKAEQKKELELWSEALKQLRSGSGGLQDTDTGSDASSKTTNHNIDAFGHFVQRMSAALLERTVEGDEDAIFWRERALAIKKREGFELDEVRINATCMVRDAFSEY